MPSSSVWYKECFWEKQQTEVGLSDSEKSGKMYEMTHGLLNFERTHRIIAENSTYFRPYTCFANKHSDHSKVPPFYVLLVLVIKEETTEQRLQSSVILFHDDLFKCWTIFHITLVSLQLLHGSSYRPAPFPLQSIVQSSWSNEVISFLHIVPLLLIDVVLYSIQNIPFPLLNSRPLIYQNIQHIRLQFHSENVDMLFHLNIYLNFHVV